MLDLSIKLSEKLNLMGELGYKTGGLIPGHPVKESFLFSLGLEYDR